jgi:hypothetical protein
MFGIGHGQQIRDELRTPASQAAEGYLTAMGGGEAQPLGTAVPQGPQANRTVIVIQPPTSPFRVASSQPGSARFVSSSTVGWDHQVQGSLRDRRQEPRPTRSHLGPLIPQHPNPQAPTTSHWVRLNHRHNSAHPSIPRQDTRSPSMSLSHQTWPRPMRWWGGPVARMIGGTRQC